MKYEIVIVVEADKVLTEAEQRGLLTFASETVKSALLGREAAELEVSGRALGIGIRPVESRRVGP
jgi:hypothetical protein